MLVLDLVCVLKQKIEKYDQNIHLRMVIRIDWPAEIQRYQFS